MATNYETFEYDVLVIGAGGAGLRAAIEASAAGVKVPKLTAEYFDLPRRFAMITPQGCFVWNKLRPIDQFSLVLKESNGPNSESVRLFFNKIYEVVICSFTTFFMILL